MHHISKEAPERVGVEENVATLAKKLGEYGIVDPFANCTSGSDHVEYSEGYPVSLIPGGTLERGMDLYRLPSWLLAEASDLEGVGKRTLAGQNV